MTKVYKYSCSYTQISLTRKAITGRAAILHKMLSSDGNKITHLRPPTAPSLQVHYFGREKKNGRKNP